MNLSLIAAPLFLAANLLDALTTNYILKHGGIEANPILRWVLHLSNHPTALLAVKIGIGVAGALYCYLAYWPGGIWAWFLADGLIAAAGIKNLIRILQHKA